MKLTALCVAAVAAMGGTGGLRVDIDRVADTAAKLSCQALLQDMASRVEISGVFRASGPSLQSDLEVVLRPCAAQDEAVLMTGHRLEADDRRH